jgi:hypothetical protein
MSDELKVLVPQETISTEFGDLVVRPFKFTQFPRVIEILSGFSGLINIDSLEAGDIVNLLMKNQGEDLFELMGMASNQDREWLDKLEAEEGFELLIRMVQQNMDFFINKLLPSITELTAAIAPKVGEKLSAA